MCPYIDKNLNTTIAIKTLTQASSDIMHCKCKHVSKWRTTGDNTRRHGWNRVAVRQQLPLGDSNRPCMLRHGKSYQTASTQWVRGRIGAMQ
jgi:hypothetical protein